MNILLLGSGGRECALAWKIKQSPKTDRLYIAPGNAGTASIGTNVEISATDFDALGRFAVENRVDMVVVGPEDPLVKGIYDYFNDHDELKHIPVIGPSKEGARLEGSKEFAKGFMMRHHIPTARYQSFTRENLDAAYAFLETLKAPYVLKADGLAAGKGVIISQSLEEAEESLEHIFGGQFGAAGAKVVIEEYLDGVEVSFFVLTDGHGYLLLPEAKDYKRIWDGDKGLNTGGMGSVSPVPFCDGEFVEKVRSRIIEPTVKGLESENMDYRGFIFFGLMNCGGDPYVIEYNVRMGDPETESVMLRIDSDLLAHMAAAAGGDLSGQTIKVSRQAAVTAIVVSGGYPEKYGKGYPVSGLEALTDITVFHAGTAMKDGKLVTSGGRVLALSATGETIPDARDRVYSRIDTVSFEGAFHRSDIALDMINWPAGKR